MEISDKIRKLLALSGNNPNAHEAQTAAEKARALMMEHHLELGDITGDTAVNVVDKALSADATAIPLWMIHLGMNIADAFRCSTYTETLRRGQQIIGYAHRIVGLAEDVDAALAVMAYCRPAAYRL
ncbi:MAG: hypothetical protein C7B46_20010 [Sulfobacillus benefaciens]|uniref:Uncharacterized protein n=1 Tax=Sulfobacillus benefaciens TaxID=453960 RepID=A0A2T2WVZ7_9FIRM|nr:MAG: hypothetical protein C7B46_20010 [Sulfobacillus benefaciens]